MKIVIAPDSYKESLTALEVANAIEAGFKEVLPQAQYVKIPMADGGEGTVQSLVDATNGRIIEQNVTGPLGNKVTAFFGVLGDGKTAVIEMAAASGLHLVSPQERNPLLTTTWGTGELIKAALDYGVTHIIVGIGGSATNDGGAGMIQALGGKLLDKNGNPIGFGGGELEKLHQVDVASMDARLQTVRIDVACDVENPLTGARGASAIFGPQKGATQEMITILDASLTHFANLAEHTIQKSTRDLPGAGAAGGLGFGLVTFLSAHLKRGIDIVLEATSFHEHVQGASLVITGEGRIDSQTIFGKTPIGVAKAAKAHHIPVIGIAGSISTDSDVVRQHGIDAVFSVVPGAMPLPEALANAKTYISLTARNIASLFSLKSI
ncbi:glycerate kinase [Metabacillus iocasae]|uniref:Glycerate kinase n=1 Tax=Priestia iocasae TaxID=2291674 RepID=A0ABS2QYF1_9BACI|nr:glycerate kinase [Metabacillus iocasae]MBM7704273.1 glycerate kinase [Metabacillus iocasae]